MAATCLLAKGVGLPAHVSREPSALKRHSRTLATTDSPIWSALARQPYVCCIQELDCVGKHLIDVFLIQSGFGGIVTELALAEGSEQRFVETRIKLLVFREQLPVA